MQRKSGELYSLKHAVNLSHGRIKEFICRNNNMLQGGLGKESKTGILKSIVFHKIPTVEFDFAAIPVTVGG
jgi:hypothetical protein